MQSGEWHDRLIEFERRYLEVRAKLRERFAAREAEGRELTAEESQLLDELEAIIIDGEKLPGQWELADDEDEGADDADA